MAQSQREREKDCCAAVDADLNKVISKFSSLREHSQRTLQNVVQNIEDVRQGLAEAPESHELSPTQTLIITQALKRVSDTISRLSTEHKDLHGSVSKIGKTVDRNFISDFNVITPEPMFEAGPQNQVLNEVLCEHFLRQGMLDIAEALNQDAQLNLKDEQKEPFLELHRITNALKEKDLGPALDWAIRHRDRLMEQHSPLEFKLHRLKFISLLKQGPEAQTEALYYARNFAPFAGMYSKELQTLMGSLLYLRSGIEKTQYATLLDGIYWDEICDVFTREACALMGLSVESPLSVSINAGCKALPPLLSIRQVMQQRQVTGVWNNKDELPVEIELGRDYHYHSIFACPILRHQSNENNPPMRLVCGHVISKDALNKLSNGNKVKCPYCPQEQAPSEAKQIFF